MNVIKTMPRLSRFRLDELDGPDGRLVCLIVESFSEKSGAKKIELAMSPDEAIRNGNALVEIGTALSGKHH